MSARHSLPTRSERQSYAKDLTKITKPELLEILEREEKLLNNKAKLDRLPDKGEKIRLYYEKVLAEVQKRDEINTAAEQFSKLNIASIGQKLMDQLEWSNGRDPSKFDNDAVDSDDDIETELDPLKIIAGSNQTNKIVKVAKEEKLITETDLKEIEELKTSEIIDVSITNKSRVSKLINGIVVKSTENENLINRVTELLEPHALHLCEKELTTKGSPKLKFLPSRTTITDVHNPQREMQRKQRKNWEPTAATPPLLKHNGVQPLTLEESIEVQRKNHEALKKLQEQNTQERLKQREIRMRDRSLLEGLMNDAVYFDDYRDPADAGDDDVESNSDDEGVLDDEDNDRGGVVYKVEG